jgi:hypothetical protein
MASDLDRLIAAAGGLAIPPRGKRWTHLSLCVLDAVHSMDADYDKVTTPLCGRYAKIAQLPDSLLPVDEAHAVIGTEREQRLSVFARWASDLGEHGLADVLDNHNRTYRRKTAPYKSRADIEYARILVDHQVETIADAVKLIDNDERRSQVEAALKGVSGHGAHHIRMDYLWMLVGDSSRIKPDRMVRRWVRDVLGRTNLPAVVEVRELVSEAASVLDCTPWELDHAVWKAQRRR